VDCHLLAQQTLCNSNMIPECLEFCMRMPQSDGGSEKKRMNTCVCAKEAKCYETSEKVLITKREEPPPLYSTCIQGQDVLTAGSAYIYCTVRSQVHE